MNFTGVWELIPEESTFGFLPPPRLRLDTILHEESHLRIQTRQKDTNGDITVVREICIGAEAVQVMIRGGARWVRAYWDDDVLVLETNSEVSGQARRILDRWTLGADANQLMIERLHEQPGGDVHQRLFLKRC
jgi:hypothetical protein